jgi:hypothetical protein
MEKPNNIKMLKKALVSLVAALVVDSPESGRTIFALMRRDGL